jgi:hypothetical protein
LLDGQPELRLVEFLHSSRVLSPSTFEQVHVLLICRFRVLCLELEAVLDVGNGWASEQVKLLIEMTSFQLRILFLRDASRLRFGVLLLHPLNLAHREVPPLLGED